MLHDPDTQNITFGTSMQCQNMHINQYCSHVLDIATLSGAIRLKPSFTFKKSSRMKLSTSLHTLGPQPGTAICPMAKHSQSYLLILTTLYCTLVLIVSEKCVYKQTPIL